MQTDLDFLCLLYTDGKKVVVFGGEGYMLDDSGDGPAPCVYILDIDSLTWHRRNTHAPTPEHSPGVRSLHVTTVSPTAICTKDAQWLKLPHCPEVCWRISALPSWQDLLFRTAS